MKRNHTSYAMRILICLMATVLSFALMSIAVSAASDDGGSVYWELRENGAVLMGDDTAYALYTLPVGYRFDPATWYEYTNTIANDEYTTVYGMSSDPDVVWTDMGQAIYVTPDGAASLDAFVRGTVTTRRLASEYEHINIEESFWGDLEAMAAAHATRAMTYDVTMLYAATVMYEITAWDALDCVYTVEGAIYALEGGTYAYVDYRTLDNSYFDSDGYFSYRSGTVALIPLDGAVAEAITEAVENGPRRESNYEYEDGWFSGEDYGKAGLMVMTVFSGVLLPIAPLVVGLILPHSKKMGYPKRWYVVSALAAVWIIVGVIQVVLLTLW